MRSQKRKGKRTCETEGSPSLSTGVGYLWMRPPGKGCGNTWPRSTPMERRWRNGSVGPQTCPRSPYRVCLRSSHLHLSLSAWKLCSATSGSCSILSGQGSWPPSGRCGGHFQTELKRLMDLAKEMTKEALPIKCLEAVILGIYLTNSMPTLERFPISFKTYFSGNYFRHIVLGVNFAGRYGALGMSRREDLMYKPPAFRTLSELVLDFEAAYGRCWHVLKKVKLGQSVSHDPHSVEQIEWKHSVLDVERLGRDDFRKELERHARDMRLKIGKGTGPPSPTKDRKKDVSSPQRAQSSPHRRNSRSERRPSGDKKPSEPKAMPDLNGYQIRV
ncbi:tubulinyl-Tyr carboxypeptidase 1 isoform X2 [Macaca fascicularis]|uniref:tubulinyl-Tyr carboxypeptidase 1 isoform X2 n=1 Tax=Macaca fascicularis TaxID=9541 RepID=UPI0003AB9975